MSTFDRLWELAHAIDRVESLKKDLLAAQEAMLLAAGWTFSTDEDGERQWRHGAVFPNPEVRVSIHEASAYMHDLRAYLQPAPAPEPEEQEVAKDSLDFFAAREKGVSQ